jgi:hypothetical protein
MPLPEPPIPDSDDLEANVRWLRDLELIKQLPQSYASGVDTLDHLMGNQYVSLDGDRGQVETWCVAHHMEADDSPLDDLILGLRYQDDVVRVGTGWKIIRRKAVKQWHRGPFPRPSLGPPIYPRSG